MPAPYSTPDIRNWSPSDWQERLAPLLAYYNVVVGGDAINVPLVATVTARNAIVAPEEGAIIMLANAGAGDPALQVYDGSAWETVWPSAQAGALPVVADIAARDALTPDEGNLVYVQDTGAGDPGIYTYDGAAWQAVWPVAAEPTVELPVYANAAARDVAVPAPAAGDLVYLTDAGAAAPAVQVHNGATWNAVWPAESSAGYDFTPPDWAWLDDAATEGTQVPFDLADWSQVTPGALSPVTLTPTLGPAGRYIILACPTGYGAFVRSQAMADGADVCMLIQPLFASATSLATGLNLEAQAVMIESVAAASRYVGAGPRWAAQGILSNTSGVNARGGSSAVSGVSASAPIGLEPTISGLITSQPMAIRMRRAGNVINFYVAEWKSGWKLIATSNSANFDPALPGLFAGIRTSVPEAERFIIWAYGYFAAGVP